MSIRITKLHLALSFMAVSLTAFFFIQINSQNHPGSFFGMKMPVPIRIEWIKQKMSSLSPIPEPEPALAHVINYSHLARQTVAIAGEEMKIAISNGLDVGPGQVILRGAKQLLAEKQFEAAITQAKQAIDLFKHAPVHLLTSYTVKRGDCLWNISKKRNVYGRGSQWVRIWRANEEKIPDFDLIYSSQDLAIPRN